ncbi:mechanosensitive ion channel family protein [Pseudaestuariivita atlantica]|uniref:Small-conductance mechanosensitive channel n=1 Tax=Pseudaestuariivita atlantica TaxID=1317121 RepID=A0A0L1JN16_9RHOB|nr:mechanosensitive ion channel family protein [Pseudaestuariivita atlantica]KNG93144.1 mechanosensitive ion channel protein MscS [Pseudaestuariivita atlantica]
MELLSNAWTALPAPTRNAVEDYVSGFWTLLPKLAIAALFLLLVWAAIRVARWILPRVLRRARMRTALVEVIVMILTTAAWLFAILVALTILFPSVTPAKAITALGLGSVAIGFAFKDVFENFLAGILLLLREPFAKGDFVECEGIDGEVETITIRDTHVRQTDGQLVVAPNAMFFKNPVTVRTAMDLRRTTIICGVAYGEDVDAARTVIEDAVKGVDDVRDDVRDVEIFAQEFADSSINFEVTWWTGSRPIDIRRSRDLVVAAVKRALDEAGIEIPFPYRTLTFNEPLPLRGAPADPE